MDKGDVSGRDEVVEEQQRIGRQIDEVRRRAGLTQVELAKRAGMSLDGISRILLGHRAPHLGSLMAIGRALDLDYRDLLADPGRATHRSSRRPSVEAVADALEGEPEAVVAAVEKCARAVSEAVRLRSM